MCSMVPISIIENEDQEPSPMIKNSEVGEVQSIQASLPSIQRSPTSLNE